MREMPHQSLASIWVAHLDVARYAGSLEHIFESTIAQVTIQTPQMDINTVAAGGGSILFWENSLFKVGPQSAGANPGPACYGKGGPLTVTDANPFLGPIIPESFPRPLDQDVVKQKFTDLTALVNKKKAGHGTLSAEDVALGFIAIANATMTRPIRTLSEGRGFETDAHVLGSFGGAGGQHAVTIARDLGIQRAIVPKYSSILSAYGMAVADVVVENQETVACTLSEDTVTQLAARFTKLCRAGVDGLVSQGFSEDQVEHSLFLNMRYQGSDTALMISQPEEGLSGFGRSLIARHHQEFGFTQPREILVDDVRVRSVAKSILVRLSNPFEELKRVQMSPPVSPVGADSQRNVFFENHGWAETAVHSLKGLARGTRIQGPAMIVDNTQTIVVDSASAATILPEHVLLEISGIEKPEIETDQPDPIQLSVFGHRFMSVAEQMGQTMQKQVYL